jgi:hypothetical protein
MLLLEAPKALAYPSNAFLPSSLLCRAPPFILHHTPVAGDGPFGGYGKWLDQFYSEESEGYDDESIDW